MSIEELKKKIFTECTYVKYIEYRKNIDEFLVDVEDQGGYLNK